MSNPFDLADTDAYKSWRGRKLAHAISDTSELLIEVKNPLALTESERRALLERCNRSNMALYASNTEIDEPGLQQLGLQLGLKRLDANWLAGEQGISRITVTENEGLHQSYIPYTDRAIKWHTDGYYNPEDRRIRAMVLHCVSPARDGGINRVMDHEIIYLLLRDLDPEHIRALSCNDAMTIPARTDEAGIARAAQSGPVFFVDQGTLHMRYTARTRSIKWKDDDATRAAVLALENLLASDTPHIHTVKLVAGEGLLCNNVLHDRSGFTDDPRHPRLLFRARYLDRLSRE